MPATRRHETLPRAIDTIGADLCDAVRTFPLDTMRSPCGVTFPMGFVRTVGAMFLDLVAVLGNAFSCP